MSNPEPRPLNYEYSRVKWIFGPYFDYDKNWKWLILCIVLVIGLIILDIVLVNTPPDKYKNGEKSKDYQSHQAGTGIAITITVAIAMFGIMNAVSVYDRKRLFDTLAQKGHKPPFTALTNKLDLIQSQVEKISNIIDIETSKTWYNRELDIYLTDLREILGLKPEDKYSYAEDLPTIE